MLSPKSKQISFYGNHIYDRVIPDLQFLYDIPDRRVEEEVNFNLVMKWFVGLDIDERPPDSSSLTRLRERLGEERFALIFSKIRVETTPGNVFDGKEFPRLVESKSKMTTADKGYDSERNHRLLRVNS